jgi:phage terminase large subunit
MNCSNTFVQLVEAYNEGYELIILQGGQGSGKTFATMQFLDLLANKKKKRLITVTSYALPHLKGGAMADFDKILFAENINVYTVKQKSENYYKINNSIIEFIGIESNPARVTGTRRNILYVNEGNNKIDYNTFDLAYSRTHELTIIDYNPRSEFWFHEKIQKNFKHKLIKTNYLNNEFLPQSELNKILSKKDKPGFENWWKVYGLGELGTLEGAILTNWHYGEFNNDLSYSFGLDFGMKDPDAMVKVAIDRLNYKIYAKQLIYKSNQSTNELAHEIIKHVKYNELIIADSASPRTIQDLKSQGLNVIGVTKFAGSVMESIKLIQDYEIIVDNESYDLGKELQNWIWIDKRGGIPLDANNHLIDSLLYNVSTIIKPHKKKSVQILNR